MMQTITASVGRLGGLNRRPDVKTVQELLNRIPQGAGGPWPRLAEDSLCGPRTVDAIQKFQVKQLGFGKADGRVDPNGPTLQKLNELAEKPPPAGQWAVLTTGTTMTCFHGGSVKVQLIGLPRIKAPDGNFALTSMDRYLVVGCPFSARCVEIRWLVTTKFLSEKSLGMCVTRFGMPTGKVILGFIDPKNRGFVLS
jgi:hypothetical protein